MWSKSKRDGEHSESGENSQTHDRFNILKAYVLKCVCKDYR